ncbi:unnamed protein product [Vicia faba]|uniref:Uncharacterized protein n=1 Tax=Vicia faba TaxID=3906 RepID=A0AAV1B5K8_VICFA|nr:unnamed protein product [Vicia faba]
MATNEDHPHDDSGHDGDKHVNKTEMEIRRGITIMKRIIRDRDRGMKYDVHWSQEGQLIEPNGSTLTSYLGSVVRREIPITCEDWRSIVLDDAKDKIRSEIQRSFNIEDTRRDYILKLAGKLHRGFRDFLSNKLLRDADKIFVDAELPNKYKDLITPEE